MSDSQRIAAEGPEVPDAATTPLMAQYLAMKRQHPDALLFYRMGDFYELFFEDAEKAAAALGIVLTTRGLHLGEPIKMCGVPIHAAEGYLNRLIRKGFKVAVCEQTEDPAEARKRGSKSVVRRDVVRVVTPGTLTEDGLLDAASHNYLCALADAGGALGLAWVDISTGQFRAQAIERKALPAALARLDPTEILLPERLLLQCDLYELFQEWKSALSPLPNARFDSENARLRLQNFHKVAALDAFGAFTRAELAAAGAILDYVELTQQGKMPRLGQLARIGAGAILEIDAATRRNLELGRTLGGERQGSLLSIIDRTVTGAGARLLGEWLSAPLTDVAAIGARQDAIAHLLGETRLRENLRAQLKKAPDLERALSRLSLERGGPRDLAAIRDGLKAAAEIRQLFAETRFASPPPLLQQALTDLGHHGDLIDRLARALGESLPLLARDGGFIAPGYLPELDQWRSLRDDSRKLILELEARYRGDLGIGSLKIKHNNVLGYFVEATTTQADKVKADGRFIQRQSTANATRFTTVELGELETKISQAAEKAVALELRLFQDLVTEVTARADGISKAAGALSFVDVAAGLAELAETESWSRPHVMRDGVFRIARGRHPVVEAGIQFTAPVEAFPPQKWDAILAINLSAAFHGIAAAVPQMKKQGWGRIINIASAHGLVGSTHKAAYVAAKHGLIGLTKVVGLEAAGTGITANAVCPGWVLTPLVEKQIADIAANRQISLEDAKASLLGQKQPSQTFVTPEQLGGTVAFLCSPAADQITGTAIAVDGAWTAQ